MQPNLRRWLASALEAVGQPIESFVKLETVDDNRTFVTRDGSLATMVRLHGARKLIGDEQFLQLVADGALKLAGMFQRPGLQLDVHFRRDPERGREVAVASQQRSRSAAAGLGLDFTDLDRARVAHLQRWLVDEEHHWVLWTRPDALTKPQAKHARQARKLRLQSLYWAPRAQNPYHALTPLRAIHHGAVENLLAVLHELDLVAEPVEVHEALRMMRGDMYPHKDHSHWSPSLPGDPLPAMAPERPEDASELLWPTLRSQLCGWGAESQNIGVVRIGGLDFAHLDMVLGPQDERPFGELIQRLNSAGVPWRTRFSIESGGLAGAGFRAALATFAGVASSESRLVMRSLEQARNDDHKTNRVKLRISLATWAPAGEPNLIEERVAHLRSGFEAWGKPQASAIAGDPLEGVLSSQLAISPESTAPSGLPPLEKVLRMLPLQRMASPITNGAMVLRTNDGKLFRYQLGSGVFTAWVDIVFGTMGKAKSVLINSLFLHGVLSPENAVLPFLAHLDVGHSSVGLIDMLRDALPAHLHHLVQYLRLTMDGRTTINPFDTQLGLRRPLADEATAMRELLIAVATPAGRKDAHEGMAELCSAVIEEMFRARDDREPGASPHAYTAGEEPAVDAALERLGLAERAATLLWWDIVDLLFDAGHIREAGLAQRHAVPLLLDAAFVVKAPHIEETFGAKTVGGQSSERLIDAFRLQIQTALSEYKVLQGPTTLELEARMAVVDLKAVVQKGSREAERRTAIMYLLGLHLLTRNWWIDLELVDQLPQRYRAYHAMRAKDLKDTPKILGADELHFCGQVRAVTDRLEAVGRTGRKYNVRLVIGSQLLDDFPQALVAISSARWILSGDSEDEVKKAKEKFGLTDADARVARTELTGPRHDGSGAPALLVLQTRNGGKYTGLVFNALSPYEVWALSTTTEDVAIRSALREALGSSAALRVLSGAFPGGSALQAIKRAQNVALERGQALSDAHAIEAIIKDLVELEREAARGRIRDVA